jgi:hypothetical protein
MNLPQPPEGILDPKVPWSRINPNSRLWLILKARLTGKPQGDGYNYSSYVNISNEEADRLIANMKKDPRGYPSLDQESGTPPQWMERQRLYQEWLVASYLNDPFQEPVSEKIVEQTSEILVEAQEEIQEAETREEVSEILEDKIDILEDIQEKISPPPNEYQRPADPWEGSETVPPPKKKPTRRKLKRPKNTVKRKKKPKASTGRKKKPVAPPPTRRQRFGRMIGGGLKKTGAFIGKTLLSGGSGGGGGSGENEGPSVLAAGAWLGKKVKKAFRDAKEQKERALEAQANGAELPPETLEPGYFIKKSIGYQFGGEAFDKTFGAFIQSMPSKQSKSKAGFGDQFDYGDSDPKKKKKANEIRDLATGFKKVSIALGAINKQVTKTTQTLEQLVNASERNSELLEGILTSISTMVGVEIDSGSDETMAQQAATGDINIPSFDISGLLGKSGGGLDWFDMLMAADDVRDIRRQMKGGKQKTTRRKGSPKITGDVPKRNRFKLPSFGKFGRRMKFSEGAASVGASVPALIGEAGPEVLIRGGMTKLAEGGVMQGTGSNILATGLGATGDLMKKVQPFANVMEMPFKVIGAQISGALASLVAAAGPFSGAIAKMFSPLLGGLATLFGLNQGAFAAEINSAAMTEEQGAKQLSKFFANFFKLFGFDISGGDDTEDTDDDTGGGYVPIDWKQDPAFGEAVNKVAKHFDISASDLMGLMASESGLRPDADNNGGHVGLIQFSATSAKAAGTTQADLKKMSRAEQMPYVQKYLENAKLPKGASAGQLYTSVFLPAFVGKPDDFVIANKDGTEPDGYPESKRWYSSNKGLDMNNDGKLTIRELGERIQKKKKEFGIPMARGGMETITSNFSNQVQGVFEMTGPDSGYKVPEELTGGQPVIGHGLEWLVKLSNKFIILPGVNKEYNVYQNPEKAFDRYEQIGKQGGVEVAGLVDFIDKLIFSSPKTGKPVRYQTGPRDAIEAIGGKYYAPYGPDSSFKPVRGAMLNDDMPEGNVMPLPIPKDTASGTSVAMVQTITPVIQQVPVYIKGDTEYIRVPANPLVAAREKARLSHYTSIT